MNSFRHSDPETIREVLDEFDAMNEAYRLIIDQSHEQSVMQWFTDLYPFVSWGVGRISWPDIPASVCRNWSDHPEQLPKFLREITVRERLADAVVFVIWITSSRPILETTLAVVQRHAAAIFDADLDTWIVCQSDGWCIEVYHEGEICFGRAPARP
jgi:hypothetical protein